LISNPSYPAVATGTAILYSARKLDVTSDWAITFDIQVAASGGGAGFASYCIGFHNDPAGGTAVGGFGKQGGFLGGTTSAGANARVIENSFAACLSPINSSFAWAANFDGYTLSTDDGGGFIPVGTAPRTSYGGKTWRLVYVHVAHAALAYMSLRDISDASMTLTSAVSWQPYSLAAPVGGAGGSPGFTYRDHGMVVGRTSLAHLAIMAGAVAGETRTTVLPRMTMHQHLGETADDHHVPARTHARAHPRDTPRRIAFPRSQ